jgi:hypothetical protein
VVDVIPVNIPEESMRHDFLSVRRTGSKSQIGLAGEELLENGYRVAGHMDGVERLVSENGVVDFVLIFASEGGLLEEHLVDEDTECPPVDCAAVLLVQENLETCVSKVAITSMDEAYLRRHELGSTAKCAGC